MSTERRRSAGGRRRADGPADESRGNGGRRGRGGHAEDERAAASRRRSPADDFWADERPSRPAPSRAGQGERPRRSRAAQDDFDERPRRSRAAQNDFDERPRRSRAAQDGPGERPRRAARAYDDPDDRPRRRAAATSAMESTAVDGRRRRGADDPDERPRRRRVDEDAGRGGRRRAGAHGARSEPGRGSRRRPPNRSDEDEFDDRGPVKRFFAKAWKPALISSGVLFIVGVVGVGIAYAMAPSPADMDQQADVDLSATVVTFDDGSSKATQFGDSTRIPVSIDEVPDEVIEGVLASEHRTFYEDGAINPVGLVRGVVFGGTQGGGSTITQQMARNYYANLTRNEPSRIEAYIRKFNEIMISYKVEQSLSKDQILEQYLNTIHFGRGLGVQAASQAYFGKDVSELNAAEGAFIGTVIQQPGNFANPAPDSEMEAIRFERWEYTVGGLVAMNAEDSDRGISQAEADELEFPEIQPIADNDNYSGYRGYIQNAVRAEMVSRYGLNDQQVAQGGYQVETSINQQWMDFAYEAVAEQQERSEIPAETQFGITAVDPATGQIKAFHGGPDATQNPDHSLVQREQAGSAFKPYVLATALEQGISLNSVYDGDGPKEFADLAEAVNNDSDVNYGPVDLIDSTKDSVNTSYVQLAEQVGPTEVAAIARAAGIPERQFETAELGSNIALGTVAVAAVDQASGFSTFANGGAHMPQHMITKIVGPEGEELVPNDADIIEQGGTQAFSADTAADATYAMQQVITPDHNARLDDGRPMAGKTGTSSDARSAWFVGFVPQLSTAVGLHRSDGEPLVLPGESSIYGGQMPSRIWKSFMTKVVADAEFEATGFPEPVYGGEVGNNVPTPTPSPEPSDTPDPEPSETPTPTPTPTPTVSETPVPCEEDPLWWQRPECADDDGGGDDGDGDGDSEETPDGDDGGGGGWLGRDND